MNCADKQFKILYGLTNVMVFKENFLFITDTLFIGINTSIPNIIFLLSFNI